MSDAPSYAKPVGIGEVMEGGTVSDVVTSNVPGFAKGAPVRLRTHALLDQSALVEVAHDAFHDLQAIEGSLGIDRWRVFPYFGTESGYLLRL